VLQIAAELQPVERVISSRHIRRSVERRGPCEQMRIPGDEEQRLLSAHAAPECIDATTIDPEPRYSVPRDRRHPREVADLTGISPGEQRQRTALALRIDHGEGTFPR
jgi:hypothetical protein